MSQGDWKRVLAAVLMTGALTFPLGEGRCEGVPSAPARHEPQSPGPLEPFVAGLVTAQLAAHRIPGATVAIVKDGRVLLVKGYGEADLERHTPVSGEETIFRVASLSKLFVWTAVMHLAEQGRLDLNADINTYIEGFQVPATFSEPVTLTHLMAHAGGFESPGRFWEDEVRFGSLKEYLVQRLPARVRPPGQLPAYSNWGAALVTHVVERVAGMPFERYLHEHVLEPLEMRHTFFGRQAPEGLAVDMALGHTYARGVWRAQPLKEVEVAASGSMGSTAADMSRFMLMHLQGGRYGERRLLQEESVRLLQQPLWRLDPRVAGWAHGFMELQVGGHRLLGHTGDAYLFHSLLALQPEHGLGVFVSYNSLGERDGAQQARMELLRALVGRLLPAAEATPRGPDKGDTDSALSQGPRGPARASRFAGTYQTTWRSYESVEASLGWMKEVRVVVDTGGAVRVQVPGSAPRRWGEVEPLVFHAAEGPVASSERLVFREDGQGHVTHLFFENMPMAAYERVPWYQSARFTLGLLAVCCALFISALGVVVLQRSPGSWLLAIVGLLNLLFLAGALVSVRYPPPQERGAPSLMVVSLGLGLVATILLPLAGWLVAQAWWRRSGSPVVRLHLTATALAAVAFAAWLHHWKLLGFHFTAP